MNKIKLNNRVSNEEVINRTNRKFLDNNYKEEGRIDRTYCYRKRKTNNRV